MDRRDFLRLTESLGLMATALGSASAGATPSTQTSQVPQPSPTPGREQTTADILVDTLIAWGAPLVFGVVGDGVNSIIEALRRRQDRIR
jgi:pyruvate dehydrogenase (quinone)/pyruvate decarboxylase